MKMRRVFGGLLLLAVLGYGGIVGWLKWHEKELVFATAASHQRSNGLVPEGGELLDVPTAGGKQLAAVRFKADAAQDRGYWILHLHGNSDSAFSRMQLAHCQRLTQLGVSALCFDYRGFGRSPGEVSEPGMLEDAEAAYQSLRAQGVPDDHILLWGHSLGSGPAVYLASRHPAAALVLFGAFTSIPEAAADRYPWLPVRWLVGVRFDSRHRLPDVRMPVFLAHSESDRVIAFHHAKELFAAAMEPKRLLVLADRTQDGFGGHVEALYDQIEVLRDALRPVIGR
jgi:alpha-beta hydrolase superfamily lysophospholipase